MKQNVASWDRALRAVAGAAMIGASFLAPVPMLVRILVFGGGGAYMVETALVGTCLGYRLMGISTCAANSKRT